MTNSVSKPLEKPAVAVTQERDADAAVPAGHHDRVELAVAVEVAHGQPGRYGTVERPVPYGEYVKPPWPLPSSTWT